MRKAGAARAGPKRVPWLKFLVKRRKIAREEEVWRPGTDHPGPIRKIIPRASKERKENQNGEERRS
jgi:hypothetical protein